MGSVKETNYVMTKLKRHKTIAFRWMTFQVASFAIILIVVGVYQYRVVKNEIYREVELTGSLAGQIFREFIAEHEDALEKDALSSMLLRLQTKLGNIEDIEVVDASGRIISDSDMDELGNAVNDPDIINLLNDYGELFLYHKEGEHNHIRVAMSLEGGYDQKRKTNIVGVVYFDLTLEQADKKIFWSFSKSLMLTALFLAALWTAGYLLIAKLFTKRLGGIMDAVYVFGRGEYSARADASGEDEIKELASTFNSMADEIQKSRNELILSQERLESANTELTDFAYVVSHDLKAPLRAITSLSNWLADDYADKFDDAGKVQFKLLVSRARRMHDLIDGILQYSRVGRLMEEKTEVDLNLVVKDAVDLISPPKNIEIRIGEGGRLPAILCEKTKMQQVFQNLISNAVKYMDKSKGIVRIGCIHSPESGVRSSEKGNRSESGVRSLEKGDRSGFGVRSSEKGKETAERINSKAEQKPGCYTFYVSDNGPGIEEKYFEKIFQLFQTLKPRDEFESTGVGLAVVKKIIDGFGGKIWVESERGEGTTFWFTAPGNIVRR